MTNPQTPSSVDWLTKIIGSGMGITRYDNQYVITGNLDLLKSHISAHIKEIELEAVQRCLEFQLPWPKDIFGEVPEADWEKIDDFATKELGYRIDCISGTLMRRGWRVHERYIKEEIAELIQKDTIDEDT